VDTRIPALRTGRFAAEERSHGNLWIVGWVGSGQGEYRECTNRQYAWRTRLREMYEESFLIFVVEIMRGFCEAIQGSLLLCRWPYCRSAYEHTQPCRNINITMHRCPLQAVNVFVFKTSYSKSTSNTAYQEVMDGLLPVRLPNRSINRPG
jgi:hypothetical protein